MRSVQAIWLAILHTAAIAQDSAPPIAFVNVTVIPMDRGGAFGQHTVIVNNGLIAAVGPSVSTRVPPGATVIDGRGKYLMPGLGDAHAHLSTVGGGTALAERAVQLFALHGVTMVRSMYTEPHHRSVAARVDRGEIVGPRVLLASPAFTGQTAPTPQLARDSLRKHHADGYRITKILPGISRETFDTLVAESKRLGMAVAGHVPAAVPLPHALGAGITSIEHLDGYIEAMHPSSGGRGSGFFGLGLIDGVDESTIPQLVRATLAAGTVVVPTEFVMELFVSTDSGAAHARRPEMRFVAPALIQQWTLQKDNFARNAAVTSERSARYRELRRLLIRELHSAGVPIALGSDAFNLFTIPGPGVFDELETYVAAGLTPEQALRTSTVNVARLLGMPSVTGTIAVGSVADLVLLDADPLVSIANVRRQAGVMIRGVWMNSADVASRLEPLIVKRP
jgi:hypothetical protein